MRDVLVNELKGLVARMESQTQSVEASRQARDVALKNGMPGLMKSASERLKRQEALLKETQAAYHEIMDAIAKIDSDQMKLNLEARSEPEQPAAAPAPSTEAVPPSFDDLHKEAAKGGRRR